MIYFKYKAVREKDCVNIDINHLLFLCDAIDSYKSFLDDLDKIIKKQKFGYSWCDAYDAIMGKKTLKTKKFEEFIKKHKDTIEIMKKYSCLDRFTIYRYYDKGNIRNYPGEDYFYKYIQEHKNDIEKIKAVLLKLEYLGFKDIVFGTHLNFTGVEHQLDTSFRWGCDFEYLENIEVSPAYLNNPIKYTTNNSCYCMYLEATSHDNSQIVNRNGNNIELNTLIFDPNRLPDELYLTIQTIEKAAEERKKEYQVIKDNVDLSISTDNLYEQFEYLRKMAEKNKTIRDNEKLKQILKEMQNQLNQLKEFGQDVEAKTIDSCENITDEIIANEKKLYLNRRYW